MTLAADQNAPCGILARNVNASLGTSLTAEARGAGRLNRNRPDRRPGDYRIQTQKGSRNGSRPTARKLAVRLESKGHGRREDVCFLAVGNGGERARVDTVKPPPARCEGRPPDARESARVRKECKTSFFG